MRRILTTLMILLAVFVAGLAALVLLVNPNDFRTYMVRQVEERSGYQLRLDGPLRWHVWPQLSILSGRMTLTAPGAAAPLVRADNMRLDVALIPLLSHQLQVGQVMLKGAVVELTPQTEAVRRKDAPVAPKENTLPLEPGDRDWSFDISRLQIADSVLVFQHEDDEQVTVRDIRLQMEQDEHHRGTVDFSGRINRDQRDLSLSLTAEIDGGDYPRTLAMNISQLDWRLQGADLPAQGISGQGSLQAQWREDEKTLSFSQLKLSANDSAVVGDASVTLGRVPRWDLDLRFAKLNLDNLLTHGDAAVANGGPPGQNPSSPPRPVIADAPRQADYASLRGFDARMKLQADQLIWRGMNFTDLSCEASNARGLLAIDQLQGALDGGHIALPGTLDARGDAPQATFRPHLDNTPIAAILNAFDYPLSLTGRLTLDGEFSGGLIDADDFRRRWRGQAHVDLHDMRAEGLNFQQLVQQAVARSANVQAQENYDNATRLDDFSSDLTLNGGRLDFAAINGASSLLALDGAGTLDLVREESDMRFNVRVLDGWKGDGKLVASLKTTAIPLRVYGKWQTLNYSLQVDQALRKQLQDEARRRLSDWAERNKHSQSGKDIKSLVH